jgi:hypothetical protein
LIIRLKYQSNGLPISLETWNVTELRLFIGKVEDLMRPETTSAAERAEELITLSYEIGSVPGHPGPATSGVVYVVGSAKSALRWN